MKQWFSNLSKGGRVAFISAVAIVAVGSMGAFAQQGQPQQQTAPPAIQAQKITTKEVIETQPVAFETTTVDNPDLEKGVTQTATEGVEGTRTIIYIVTQKDGIETSRTEKSNTITTQPINKVVHSGTKAPAPSCPNGSYINSAGNNVCRPAVSDSAPAGASAQCRDGSYSYSQSRRGTCSHHGGVSRWL